MALSNYSAAFAMSLPAEPRCRAPDLPTSAAYLRKRALLSENWQRQACRRMAYWFRHFSARECVECRLARVDRSCCPALARAGCPLGALRCLWAELPAPAWLAETEASA